MASTATDPERAGEDDGLSAPADRLSTSPPRGRGWVLAAIPAGIAAFAFVLYQFASMAIDAHGVKRGAVLYAGNCAACHGAALEGQIGWQSAAWQSPGWQSTGWQSTGWQSEASAVSWPAPPLDAAGHAWMHDDAALFLHTKNGSARSPMPAFGERLADNEIWQIFAYVKSHWPESLRAFQRRGDPYAPLPGDLPAAWTYPPACEPGAAPGGARP